MLCVNPYRTGEEEFGCGRCLTCRASRRRIWVARILLELQVHGHGVFVTLTYKDEPGGFQWDPDVQMFLDRLRKRLGRSVRYFGVCERGSRRGRIHYHLALFGVSLAEAGFVESSWTLGFTHVGELNPRSAHYIAGYVQKKLGDPDVERARMSLKPGIGAKFAGNIASAIKSLIQQGRLADVPPSIRHERSLYSVGRYVRNKARVELGLPALTPPEERARQKLEYAAEDANMRERKRTNGYNSALSRYLISLSKEKL